VPIHRPATDRRIPSTVGTAFDYRLRYYLAATRVEDMVAATGMRLLDPTRTSTKTRGAPDEFLALFGGAPPASVPSLRYLRTSRHHLRRAGTSRETTR
jgi:hypothetical protein